MVRTKRAADERDVQRNRDRDLRFACDRPQHLHDRLRLGRRIHRTYTNVQINAADQYGRSGGNTRYAVSFSTYSLDLTSASKRGVTFFGYRLSALDAGNLVSFYSRGREFFTFKPADVVAVNASATPAHYYGNPTTAFAGQNRGEPYILLSFYSNDPPFDKVVFNQAGGGGDESDNHTVGRFTGTGTSTLIPLLGSVTPGAVPEPATWAMMVGGFALVGAGMRRRTRNTVAA